MKTRVCAICSAEFMPTGTRSSLCAACWSDYAVQCLKANREGRVCELEGCDKRPDGSKRVCSMHRQRMKYHGSYGLPVRVRQAKEPKLQRVVYCVICGSAFAPISRQITCNKACAKVRQLHTQRASKGAVPWDARPLRRVVCGGCSVVFETPYPSKRYHSEKCGVRHSEAGIERKRAQKKMVRLRLRLWARDGACYLCAQPIDYSLAYPHDMSPQTDHLTPLSMGGPTVLDNLAVVHKRCNEDKADAPAAWWQRDQLHALRADPHPGGTTCAQGQIPPIPQSSGRIIYSAEASS